MTDSQEYLKVVAPGLLAVIWVHVREEEAMAAAVAEVLAGDGLSVREVARLHGVNRSSLERSVKGLRAMCLSCSAKMGLDPRSMLAVRGDGEEEEFTTETRRHGGCDDGSSADRSRAQSS